MATTVTNESRIVLLAAFSDEDDRSISLPNPKATITPADIENLNTLAANVLIGDKFGAGFTSFKQAKTVETTRTDYDLSV